MSQDRYIMSFTSGALLREQSTAIAEVYVELRDWEATHDKVMQSKLLKARTARSAKIIAREIVHRLKCLSDDELEVVAHGGGHEVTQMVWVAICRYYKFIGEFVTEVIAEQLLSMRYELDQSAYNAFFNSKAEWHDELDSLSESSQDKVRQVLFKMLKEVGILNKENRILPILLESRVRDVLGGSNLQDLQYFPGAR